MSHYTVVGVMGLGTPVENWLKSFVLGNNYADHIEAIEAAMAERVARKETHGFLVYNTGGKIIHALDCVAPKEEK